LFGDFGYVGGAIDYSIEITNSYTAIFSIFALDFKTKMNPIKRKYIVDENNTKVAVQIDLKTFGRIEQILEDYALYKLMQENDSDELLNLNEAKEYYKTLKQKD
jgi:hypothetical protein